MSGSSSQYSVLMSTYKNDDARFLEQALSSLANQTVMFQDLVLVCDGPISDSLNSVISHWSEHFGSSMNIIRLSENCGLGRALQHGLPLCACEYVARMDSDDISSEDRCEKQLKAFTEDPSLSVVSGTIEEFENIPGDRGTKRVLPCSYD